jgi:hypothetical protein
MDWFARAFQFTTKSHDSAPVKIDTTLSVETHSTSPSFLMAWPFQIRIHVIDMASLGYHTFLLRFLGGRWIVSDLGCLVLA